jgi:hypothetical protein
MNRLSSVSNQSGAIQYQVCGMLAEGYLIGRVAKFLSISDKQVKSALKFASIVFEQ